MKIGTILLSACFAFVVSCGFATSQPHDTTSGTRNGDVCMFIGTSSTLTIAPGVTIGAVKLSGATNAKTYSIYSNQYDNGATSGTLLWRHVAETGDLSHGDQLGSVNAPPGGFFVYQETTATLFIYLRSP